MRPLLKRLPKGDGHPVIVFPGFVSSDNATQPLRSLLTDLGYQTHGWGLGLNIFFGDELEEEMIALVREVAEKTGQKVSLVGWSLGGLYAREVAKVCADQVRSVTTLGSPISGKPEHSHAHGLFKAFNGEPTNIDHTRYFQLQDAPPVPTTSIFSHSDGVVAWEGSLQKESDTSESIVVPASHIGMGVNPLVMYVLADRLSQPIEQWAKFKTKGLKRLFFKKSKAANLL
ncbi:MAG: pimeloyl-ACP methyl ester carboxylesterase [Arenicella sp.]|jgi:pimeloyl-ACP methyl ester carboxylesterase